MNFSIILTFIALFLIYGFAIKTYIKRKKEEMPSRIYINVYLSYKTYNTTLFYRVLATYLTDKNIRSYDQLSKKFPKISKSKLRYMLKRGDKLGRAIYEAR